VSEELLTIDWVGSARASTDINTSDGRAVGADDGGQVLDDNADGAQPGETCSGASSLRLTTAQVCWARAHWRSVGSRCGDRKDGERGKNSKLREHC